jgi:isoleucyl-tRNA synthetase
MPFPSHESVCSWFRGANRTLIIMAFPVSAPFNFVEEEKKVLAYWDEIDAFQTSLKLSEGRPEYIFYDGPPFATGLPHCGNLLVCTIKVRIPPLPLASH